MSELHYSLIACAVAIIVGVLAGYMIFGHARLGGVPTPLRRLSRLILIVSPAWTVSSRMGKSMQEFIPELISHIAGGMILACILITVALTFGGIASSLGARQAAGLENNSNDRARARTPAEGKAADGA